MNADTRTLQQVLQGDRRFAIPVYQRPYVWERERQWEPLWADIEATVTRLAETRSAAFAKDAPVAEADRGAAPHFLGAVVLEQFPTATGDVDQRSVVDGQQRLTTLQLLLRGVLDSLEKGEIGGPTVKKIRRLIRNDEEVLSGDALYKVWPRPADQGDYLAAMEPRAPEAHASNFAAARAYFAEAATGFLEDADVPEDPYGTGSPFERRASLLVATLLGLVKLVVIDLDDVDDAQVIFEALNARNTPLSATDLVKNLLFMRAQARQHDATDLYQRVWTRFDDSADWWREQVGSGHAQRARQDWLLGDWLTAQLARVINVGRLYSEFRGWLDVSGTDPVHALESLNRYADAYESLHGKIPGTTAVERRAFQRLAGLGMTAATPIMLWLLVQPQARLPLAERELAFRAIESFVIRRMAAKWQSRGYSNIFGEVLKAAAGASIHPGYAIIAALRDALWPADAELVHQFRVARYYGPGGINQHRLRLVLGAAEARLQSVPHKAEPVAVDYDALQVEHVMPKEWPKHWPVEAEDAATRAVLTQEREAHVHRIGNLTLVSSRLNPSMSNGGWATKRAALGQHSHLRLNALLTQEEAWDEERIVERGEWLARQIGQEWPGPDDPVWTRPGDEVAIEAGEAS